MSRERWLPLWWSDLKLGLEALRLAPEEIERREKELAEFLRSADTIAMKRLGVALCRLLTERLRAQVQARALGDSEPPRRLH